jgi:multisubunit Na+/H+ antiporter MnhE subunit
MMLVFLLGVLTAVYVFTIGNNAWEDVVTGFVLAAALLWIYRRIMFPKPLVSNREMLLVMLQTPRYLAVFLLDVLQGTWQVAMYVVGIRSLTHPGIIKVYYSEESRVRLGIALLAMTISPGSFVIDVNHEERFALVHLIDISDPDKVRENMRRTYFNVPGSQSVRMEVQPHA